MWTKTTDEMPPIGAAVLLCARVGGVWRFMAVPEWTEQNRALNRKKTGVYWQRIEAPKDEEKSKEN